jgi:hypothetical protein
MDTTDSGTPITSSYWNKMDLGIKESTLNGNLDFFSNLDTNTNVTLSVTGGNNSLESGSLTGLSLLLDGENAHDFIGKFVLDVSNKSVNDWCFLDWDGVSVNFFKGCDVSGFDESSEFGKWGPFFLESTSTTTSATESTSAASTTTASSVTSASATFSSITSFATFSSSWCLSSSSWLIFWSTHI